MRRILITGGAGFIGSALIRRLWREPDVVLCNFDKLTYAASPEALADIPSGERYRLVRADICDAGAVRASLAAFQPDAVLHLAAESHVDRSIDAPDAFVMTNVVGTATLLQGVTDYWRALPMAARAAFRFVHISTDEVFGSLSAVGRFTEASPHAPNSPYAASKAAADHMVRAWHHTYGLPTIVCNASNTYGPFQFPEKLIPLIIAKAWAGQPLPVYGDGGQVRDWLHVDDHAAALCSALSAGLPGQTYLVGGGAERRNIDVVAGICDTLDAWQPHPAGPRRRLITHVADRPGHDRRYAVDWHKLHAQTGWRPQHSFDSGLRDTVAWYVAHAAWWQGIVDGRYDGARLGLSAGDGR
jgi:dTDP-glucose 4,6-dehydratase